MLEHLIHTNFILQADSYKFQHFEELPDDAEFSYVVVVPRKVSKYTKSIAAMGQAMVASYFASVRITNEMIDEAEAEASAQGYEINRKAWEIIVNEIGGCLPLQIMGIDEGRIIKPQTPIMSIVNTDSRFPWLPTYVETIVQNIVWKMTTVASICKTVRTSLEGWCEFSGTDKSAVNFMLHNFGDRGADGPEAAVIAGIAHAALFDGSDCSQTNRYIKKLYNTQKSYTSSIEATEHSVMCSHSNAANRDDFGAAKMLVKRLASAINRASRGIGIPFISGVIDTYDSRRFVRDYIGTQLKQEILDLTRDTGGRLICRPDSGNPTKEPGLVGKDLQDTFGITFNSKGFKVLHPSVGVIQGDGIRVDTFESVIEGWICGAGFSLDNFALGMGSGVTHDGGRDDFSFSVKAIALSTASQGWTRLLKEPITDKGKTSLTGLIACKEVEGELVVYDALATLDAGSAFSAFSNSECWHMWFCNGRQTYQQSFDDVRARARA